MEETKLVNPAEKPIKGAHYTDNLQKFLERKLYVINCGHAYAGYLGYINGYTSVYDVFTNPEMGKDVHKAMRESAALITEKYDFTEDEMREYVDFGMKRYQMKGVDYPVSMVTRSPIRKLGASDRMVGPCIQCAERGLPHEGLTKGVALILLLDSKEDEQAVELQQYIAEKGVAEALTHYTGIKPDSPLHAAILKHYEAFKRIRDSH